GIDVRLVQGQVGRLLADHPAHPRRSDERRTRPRQAHVRGDDDDEEDRHRRARSSGPGSACRGIVTLPPARRRGRRVGYLDLLAHPCPPPASGRRLETPMLELHGHLFSSYTWKALIPLYANGTDFEFRAMTTDRPLSEQFPGKAHPGGHIPVLVDGERVVVE